MNLKIEMGLLAESLCQKFYVQGTKERFQCTKISVSSSTKESMESFLSPEGVQAKV